MTNRCRYCGGYHHHGGDCHPTFERMRGLLDQANRSVDSYRRENEKLEAAWRAFHGAMSRYFEAQKGR